MRTTAVKFSRAHDGTSDVYAFSLNIVIVNVQLGRVS